MNNNIFLEKQDGTIIAIDKLPFFIGSIPQICNLVIEGTNISPIHATIDKKDNKYIIQEGNSRIGLNLNNNLLENGEVEEISDDDIIQIGETIFTFKESNELFTEKEQKEINETYKKLLNADSKELEMQYGKFLVDTLATKLKQILSMAESEDLKKYLLEQLGIKPEVKQVEREPQSTRQPQSTPRQVNPNNNPSATEIFMNRGGNSRQPVGNQPRGPVGQPSGQPNNNHINITPGPANPYGQTNQQPQTPQGGRKVEHEFLTDQKRVVVLQELRPPHLTITVEKTPFKIGKNENFADFPLDRRGISRQHATILYDEDKNEFYIQDNNATNGTFLNNNRIINSMEPFSKDDVISFYEYAFKVLRMD